jgi:hypothetical protein
VNAAREEAQAMSADLVTATLTIQAELAYDYFELRAADAQKQLLMDTVKAYNDALTLTENRFEGGASPKSDVAQAQTQLDTTTAQETDIDVERAQVAPGRRPTTIRSPRRRKPRLPAAHGIVCEATRLRTDDGDSPANAVRIVGFARLPGSLAP